MLPTTMKDGMPIKKWQSHMDGIDNMVMVDDVRKTPGPNEVLVKINAISLNYRDTEVIMGLYNHHKTTGSSPLIVPCSDMVGDIVEVGKNLKQKWAVHDRVLSIFNQAHLTGSAKAEYMKTGLGLPLDGVLRQYRIFPSEALVRCPGYLFDDQASTLPIAALTAWMSINGMREMGRPGGAGETILLQGTGGVAINGLLIAVASGAITIVTSSSDEKLAKARSLGATHTINYKTTPDWEEEVNRITNGEGVDIIFEAGGAKTLRKSFDCVAFGGLINCIGYLSGKEDEPGDRLNTNVLALRRNVTLKGILNGPRDRFEEMCVFFDKHQIRPVVDRVFKFEEAKEALHYLFSGSHFGKVVIISQWP